MSNWISVHDVEIPKDTCIDVWMDYGDCTGRICNCFLGDDENSMWKWNENCDGKVTFPAYGITHWMPLPEHPATKTQPANTINLNGIYVNKVEK